MKSELELWKSFLSYKKTAFLIFIFHEIYENQTQVCFTHIVETI